MKVRARIFESDEEATEAIKTGKINPGDVIVIRYEGTERRSGNAGDAQSDFGDCRIRTRLGSSAYYRRTFQRRVKRRIYRSCFSGSGGGRSRIALVEEGDIIQIDIPNLSLNLAVSEEELKKRREKWQPREPKVKTGYLARYASMVTSGNRGAILEIPKEK